MQVKRSDGTGAPFVHDDFRIGAEIAVFADQQIPLVCGDAVTAAAALTDLIGVIDPVVGYALRRIGQTRHGATLCAPAVHACLTRVGRTSDKSPFRAHVPKSRF